MSDQPPAQKPKATNGSFKTIMVAVVTILFLVVAIGASKLSYDKYGSFSWAFLAFLVAPLYYPYYAYFVSTRTIPSFLGGRRR